MSKKPLMAMAVAGALSTALLASGMAPVFAADNPTQGEVAKAQTKAMDKTAKEDFLKVSEDAQMTMRNLRGARLAIFNGMTEEAQTYLDAAVSRSAATVKDADKFAADSKQPAKDDEYVPFDATLTVADTFVPTEQKIKHIAKANEHLRKGEKKEALEVLQLGGVDVAVSTKLVPAKLAQSHISQADKLVSEGKYYEANLALKAVEDAVVIETVAIDAAPKDKAKS